MSEQLPFLHPRPWRSQTGGTWSPPPLNRQWPPSQVEQYNPPPNYAKITDTRSDDYINRYGNESWELDALEPRVMRQLIIDAINSIRDDELWNEYLAREASEKQRLRQIADEWNED